MSDRRAALVEQLRALAPALRGKLAAEAALAPYTWFRVGGPAEALYSPADEDDLAYLLRMLPRDISVTTIGVGSNLIVRDGGVRGLVIRLGGKRLGAIETTADRRVVAGAAALDSQVARAAAEAGIDGFVFLRGVPGSIGGALRMNAGAYGGEISGLLVEARGVDRSGATRVFSNAEMGFSYRHCGAPADVIFTRAVFQGRPGAPEAIRAEMESMMRERETIQPIHDKTSGSTFKNPPGHKAWQLIDAAGCRGLVVGDAQVSTLHCNFLINRGGATAADIEALGEDVRRRVKAASGVELEWEIKRIGEAL
jgi:UDP-N-acetylmuramate dehydrogenase